MTHIRHTDLRQSISIKAWVTLLAIGGAILLTATFTAQGFVGGFNTRALATYKNRTYGLGFAYPKSAPLKITPDTDYEGNETGITIWGDREKADRQFNAVGRDESDSVRSVTGNLKLHDAEFPLYASKDAYFSAMRERHEQYATDETRPSRIIGEPEYKMVQGNELLIIHSETASSIEGYPPHKDTDIYAYGSAYTLGLSISHGYTESTHQVNQIIESIRLR